MIINEAKKLVSLYETNVKRLDDLNNMITDYMHEIELGDIQQANEKAKSYTKFRKLLKERREVKDYINGFHIIFGNAELLTNKTLKHEKFLEERFYTKRYNEEDLDNEEA